MILAIVLVLLMLFCAIAEFSRLWIIAQGVKEAAQQAVISTINDNYDDVYHAVREGYAAGWYPDGTRPLGRERGYRRCVRSAL